MRGAEGFYHYRQYDAVELAERYSLEEAWYFLYEGELPRAEALAAFEAELAPLRTVPPAVAELLPPLAKLDAQPLAAVRAALAMLAAAEEFEPWIDVDEAERRRQALRLCAVYPSLLMGIVRLGRGEEPVEPDPELGYAANYLYLLNGEPPPPDRARGLEQYLTSTIEHGFNASAFTARVITSTGADVAAAVLGALGALSGPLHGGAPSRALAMLDAIGEPERADEWIQDALARGDRLMGFGHPVYQTEDPRSRFLRGVAERLGGPKVELAKHVESRALELLRAAKPDRELHTNVEYYASLVLEDVGLPPSLFTPTFAASRLIGWTAHALEQMQDNQVIRPAATYVGPEAPQPLP